VWLIPHNLQQDRKQKQKVPGGRKPNWFVFFATTSQLFAITIWRVRCITARPMPKTSDRRGKSTRDCLRECWVEKDKGSICMFFGQWSAILCKAKYQYQNTNFETQTRATRLNVMRLSVFHIHYVKMNRYQYSRYREFSAEIREKRLASRES
jgi:hypothetical protein